MRYFFNKLETIINSLVRKLTLYYTMYMTVDEIYGIQEFPWTGVIGWVCFNAPRSDLKKVKEKFCVKSPKTECTHANGHSSELWKDYIFSSLLIIFKVKFYLAEITSYIQNLSHMLFPKYVLNPLHKQRLKNLPNFLVEQRYQQRHFNVLHLITIFYFIHLEIH